MGMRLKFSLLFALVSVAILAAFSGVVYSRIKTKLFDQASRAISQHLEHEWGHIVSRQDPLHHNNPTLIHPEIQVQVIKDGKLLGEAKSSSSSALVQSITRKADGHGYELIATHSLATTSEYLAALQKTLILACLVAALGIVPLSLALTSALLKPFRNLLLKTAELDAKNLSFRFPEPERQDEYGVLVRHFNRLLHRLERSFLQTRRFAKNASHELRTPLTVIRGEAEFTLRRERAASEYQAALGRIVSQTDRLQAIVARLLALSEVERLEEKVESSHISVNQAIAEALEVLQKVHRQKKDVRIEGENIVYVGPGELFTSVVNNLLENAVKYSHQTILVAVRRGESGLHLSVEDDGAGIDDSQKDEVFQPFFKGDAGSEAGGHGLGLSIVKACLEAGKGSLKLGDSKLGGLKVEIFFPQPA